MASEALSSDVRGSILSQPRLQLGELDRTGFDQSSVRELADPVVRDADSRCDGPVLPYPIPDRFSGAVDPLFYVHGVDSILATLLVS